MKKKNIFIVVVLIVVCAICGFLMLNRNKSVSDMYEAAGINYEECVERATKVEITVPADAIKREDENYKGGDKVVAVLTKEDELDAFFDKMGETKGHKEPAPTENYENPFFQNLYMYVITVYDDESVLFKTNLSIKNFGPDADNIKVFYVLKDDNVYFYICEELDEHAFGVYGY